MSDPKPSRDSQRPLFGRLLRFWREVHDISQEDLAFGMEVSARHISFLETGRAAPSKNLVEKAAEALSLGDRDRGHLLFSAGFVPDESGLDFHSPQLKWLRKAMAMTLKALEPYPSVLMDSMGKILMVNRGWVTLFSQTVAKDVWDSTDNIYDFIFARNAGGTIIDNWENTLSAILVSLQQGALLTNEASAFSLVERLAASDGVPTDWMQRGARVEPTASFKVQLEVAGQLHRFYSVSQTVGAAGPAAFVSGPRMTINTFYPEDKDLSLLSEMKEEPFHHPLLVEL